MNCFGGMIDWRKVFSLISSWDHCQRFLPLRISDTPQAGFEPVQNLSSGLVEWGCALVINHYITAPLSTTLCSFFRNLCKSVILPLSKSYKWDSTETNCISLYNEFGAKVFRNLVKRRVNNWKSSFHTLVVVEVVNTEIFMSFIKLRF